MASKCVSQLVSSKTARYLLLVSDGLCQLVRTKQRTVGNTDLNNHFSAGHVALSLRGFLLSLMYHSFASRSILQCKVAHGLAERADFQIGHGLLRVAEILQKRVKPAEAIATQRYATERKMRHILQY